MFIKYIECIVSDAAYPLKPFVMSCPVTRLGGSNLVTGCFAIYNRIVNGINSTLSIVKQGCHTYSVEKEHSCERSVCYTTAVQNSSINTSHFCCCNHANCNYDVALIQATNTTVFEKIESVQLPHTERIIIITLITFLVFSILLLILVCKCDLMSPSSRFGRKKREERDQHTSPIDQ
ncbi:unnamed protein product [Auanema sp. JU1783]|nr:unnamed protein product [Auanema sp. JU1783]